jgi:hypothetical protein
LVVRGVLEQEEERIMFESRVWTMIVLSSLIAAPGLWFINAGSVARIEESRPGGAMYHLVSVNSAETDPVMFKGFMTAERWLADPRHGSDFPVSGRFQFARKGAPDAAANQYDNH